MTVGLVSAPQRGAVSLLLATAMGVSVLPSFCLTILAGSVIRDLAMSRTELGVVVGAGSAVAAISTIGLGALADRRGGRFAVIVAFVFGVGALGGIAIAPSFPILLAAAVLAGLCLGAATPATNLVVLFALSRGRRGLLTGVKQAGETVAIVLAGALLPSLAILLGWRGAVGAAVAIPLFGILATFALIPVDAQSPPAAAGPSGRAPLSHDVWWLTTYTLVMGLSGGAVSTYVALYAQERVGVSVATSGYVLALMGAVAIAGRIVWGHLAERATAFPMRFIVLSGLTAIAAACLWAASILGPMMLWAGAVMWGLSQLSFAAVTAVAIMAFAGREVAGRASGILLVGFSIGLMCGPILFGVARDASGGYDLGFAGVLLDILVAMAIAVVWGRRPAESRPNPIEP